ncbi:MAG: hypothetical protein KGI33_02090 [Thaumarchaeota archaeon]|nr:hypothetical protein [Nitrososphaerota archaeon]
MFDQSLGEVVVSVFAYIGVGGGIFLGGVIGMVLIGDAFHKAPKAET